MRAGLNGAECTRGSVVMEFSAALFVPFIFSCGFHFRSKAEKPWESFGTIQRRLAWHVACISPDVHGISPAFATWLKKSTAAAVAAAQVMSPTLKVDPGLVATLV